MEINYNEKLTNDLAEAMIAQANDTKNTTSSALLRKGANHMLDVQKVLFELMNVAKSMQAELETLKSEAAKVKRQYDYATVLDEFMKSGEAIQAITVKCHHNCGSGTPDAGCFRNLIKKNNYPIEATQKRIAEGNVKVLLIRTDM